MTVTIDGTAGIANNATDLSYTGTLTGSTGVVNIGSGQVYKDASGNVGVGLTNPHAVVGAKVGTFGANSNTAGCSFGVDSSGATQPIMGLRWTGANGGIAGSNFSAQLVSDSANALFTEIYTTGATPLVFGTNSTERARIDSSGNLLVGATSPIQTGCSYIVGGNSGGVIGSLNLRNRQSTAGKYNLFGPTNDADPFFVIYNQSSVGVYLAPNATSWTAGSDETTKENLVPIMGALSSVASLRTVIGNYITDEAKTKHPFLIAQDVQKVLPEAVSISPDGTLGLAYTEVIPLLVAAIQEQQAIITALTTRITALEAK